MDQDELKSAVGKKAVEYIEPKFTQKTIFGVGTGSTTNFFIDALAEFRHRFGGAQSRHRITEYLSNGFELPNITNWCAGAMGIEVINSTIDICDRLLHTTNCTLP